MLARAFPTNPPCVSPLICRGARQIRPLVHLVTMSARTAPAPNLCLSRLAGQ